MLEAPHLPTRPSSTRIVTASASGPDPDRVLVFGDAVFAPGLPLHPAARRTAQALAARTGRGADVTAVPWSSWTGQTLVAAGNGIHLANHDVVMVCLSGSVVHSRTTTTAVVGAAEEALVLVDQLRPRLAPTAEIVLALAHDEDRTDLVAALHRARPDLVVLRVEADATSGVPSFLLEVTQLLLEQQRSRAGSPQWLRSTPQPFAHRYDAIRRLGIVDAPADAALDRLVQHMTELFGTKGAAITFLPEGRQWSAASTWIPRGSQALQDSFCRSTVLRSGAMVIGDAWDPDRPRIARRGRIRFYAGHPLESVDGTRIGAVCVFDPTPRREDTVELDLLRDFAVLARDALYRPEDSTRFGSGGAHRTPVA
ncbi:GAF domain-containing protein [Curtobacterium sp. MCSS17_007]|uniref:GAF domain-containing protein n=1 Tax=Curtobacterium sp. MCSS17_007 TaxID=2175646 RepID=UPI0011B5388A|nr:GAF domain-containing protein [Curtobacterium sp. MCSS17_007]WIE75649.1 GAF domain-containing protein [Curtobacterium sp. MCSS17_007]